MMSGLIWRYGGEALTRSHPVSDLCPGRGACVYGVQLMHGHALQRVDMQHLHNTVSTTATNVHTCYVYSRTQRHDMDVDMHSPSAQSAQTRRQSPQGR